MSTLSCRKKSFLALFITCTLFFAGGTAALQWESPASGDAFQTREEFDLNVSNNSEVESVFFWEKTEDENNYESIGSANIENGYAVLTDFSRGLGNSGEYEIRANHSGGEATLTNIVIDGEKPEVNGFSPEEDGFATSSDITVSFDASDDLSGIDEESYEIEVRNEEGDNGFDEQLSDDNEIVVDDLENEAIYEVEYNVSDEVGNYYDDSWSFEVDSSYEGDSDPDFSWDPSPIDENENILAVDEEAEVELTASFEDRDENPSEMICYEDDTDGRELDSDDTDDENGATEFSCNIDEVEDYKNEDLEIMVEFCDNAGNCETQTAETIFDTKGPVISDLSTAQDTVNSEFQVDFEAEDRSGIQELEYSYSSSFDEVETYEISDQDEPDISGSFKVDPSELESGEHKLFLRAIDGADREGEYVELEFAYLPNAKPKVALSSPSRIEITAGNESSIDVRAENTGKLFIQELEISSIGAVSSSKAIEDLTSGDSENLTFDLSTSSEDIGKSSVKFSSNYSTDAKTQIRIVANDQQQRSIEQELSGYEKDLKNMKSNLTSLRSKASTKITSPVASNVSAVEQKISTARSAVESGKYYEAESTLNGLDSEIKITKTAYSSAKNKYQNNRRFMMIIGAVGIIGLIGLGSGAYLYKKGKIDIEIKKLTTSNDSIKTSGHSTDEAEESSKGLIEKIKEKLESSTSSEKDAEDFEWNGFN